MGKWWNAAVQVGRRLMGLPTYAFDSAPAPIADVLAALDAVSDARVSRSQAISVQAVLRARNEICGAIGTMPLRLYRGLDIIDHPLFRQIDPDRANVNVLADTVEDLLFERVAWWRITAQDFDGYPLSARYVPVGTVSLEPPKNDTPPPGKWVWISTSGGQPERVPMSLMIRFESPNPGMLTASARAIRRALLLDKLASTYADNPRPLDYFTDTDDPNVEPFSEQDWSTFLARWRMDRKRTSTARLPGQVKRVDVDAPSPADLQLVELQKQVTVEIANGANIDAEDLGVSVTTRTYQNEDAKRRDKINRVFGPFMAAISDRLSMGDTTRRG